MKKPDVVFIMSPRGTMTPFHSGALTTNLRGCALAARADGFEAIIVVRDSSHPPYEDVNARFVQFPEHNTKVSSFLARLDRKVFGWPLVGQRQYAGRVARALSEPQMQGVPWIISNDPNLAVYLRRRFPKASIVHRFHNQMEANDRVKNTLARSVNACVAVSDFTRDWVEKNYHFAPGAIKTVYNGVDSEQFHPAEQEVAGAPVLNFVGRTGIEKGADILIEAAILLAQRTPKPDFSVQIVGSNYWGGFSLDEYQTKLQESIETLEKLGVAVRRTGHVNRNEVAAEFRRAHIHIVPSRWDEPFGLTTVEGMASGLATVASKTGGSPEIIGDAGFLFERDNAEDLAQKLLPLVENTELRRDYSRRARARALEFSWDNTWKGLKKAAAL